MVSKHDLVSGQKWQAELVCTQVAQAELEQSVEKNKTKSRETNCANHTKLPKKSKYFAKIVPGHLVPKMEVMKADNIKFNNKMFMSLYKRIRPVGG